MPRHRRVHSPQQEPRRIENSAPANNMDMTAIASLLGNIDMNKLATMLTAIGTNVVSNTNNTKQNESIEVQQRKNELLKALNTLINADKSELLQVAFQLYMASKTNANNIGNNG